MKRKDRLNIGLAAISAIVVLLMALRAEAQLAQASCGARTAIVERLATHFGETRRGIGLGTGNRVLEVFASDNTGTWTVTVTLPDGRMCLVAAGTAWEDRMDDLSDLQDSDT